MWLCQLTTTEDSFILQGNGTVDMVYKLMLIIKLIATGLIWNRYSKQTFGNMAIFKLLKPVSL